MTTTSPYAELHCLSNFSFGRGASHPEELVQRAAELGYRAIAITDECSVAGVVRAHVEAKRHNIQLLIGSEFQLECGLRCVLIATNRQGYGQLSALITHARRAAIKGEYLLDSERFTEHFPTDCLGIWLPAAELDDIDASELDYLQKLGTGHTEAERKQNWWIAVEHLHDNRDAERLQRLESISAEHDIPLIACGDVHMHSRSRRALHDVITAIRYNTRVDQLGKRSFANGERHLRSLADIQVLHPEAQLDETIKLAQRCAFSLDELRYEYPRELVPDSHSASSWLRELSYTGAASRYRAGIPNKVRQQVEHELALIEELHYEAFFLTAYDIVRFARSQGILCQGRGSGANSAVCYCLGITEVDPAEATLLFERFLSRERDEPPDIDVDFEHERREEVIQYIYQKYTRERAALAATVISYRSKSALRDVGKALGFSQDQLDLLAQRDLRNKKGTSLSEERVAESGLDRDSPQMRRLDILSREILGFPRHLSQHVGGFVISRGPLSELVPVENASMADRTVIQWDKDDLESLGLLKVDVLGLGMLTCIRRAFDLIASSTGKRYTLANVPHNDEATYAMLHRADTIGVFQIESRAQMSMLPRLRPTCLYDLVIQVAIVRPGPIQGDMVHPYLRRRNGEEKVDYPSAAVKSVLERTLGVPIFQEQVMDLAIKAAGFSPGEADQLRRAMAAWKKKGGLHVYKEKLQKGMTERGYSPDFAERIYNQILGFGDYGFPESHAASFAALAYISSWLKCHYPAAFAAALINSQPMGFYAPAQIVQDARKHHVLVMPPDINHSEYDCTLEKQKDEIVLRLGFRLVKSLSADGTAAILDARTQGPFRNLQDLSHRTQLSQHDLRALATSNALKSIAGHRYKAHWNVLGTETELPLFTNLEETSNDVLLAKPTDYQETFADYSSYGLSLQQHPMELIRDELEKEGYVPAASLWERPEQSLVKVIGLVTGRQRPGTASGIVFVTLEDETGSINVVVWGRSSIAQHLPLMQSKVMAVNGIVEQKDGVLHVIAGKLTNCNHRLPAFNGKSRNFH